MRLACSSMQVVKPGCCSRILLGCGCRAPSLRALALNLTRAPGLMYGLVESAGASLQHLQLVMADHDLPGQGYGSFWRAIKACTELVALQLIFAPGADAGVDREVTVRKILKSYNNMPQRVFPCYSARCQSMDPDLLRECCVEARQLEWRAQVCFFLVAADRAGHCLPKLASMALYSEPGAGGDEFFNVRTPPPTSSPGAQGVCDALGRLVTAGILPALTQARIAPPMDLQLTLCITRAG